MAGHSSLWRRCCWLAAHRTRQPASRPEPPIRDIPDLVWQFCRSPRLVPTELSALRVLRISIAPLGGVITSMPSRDSATSDAASPRSSARGERCHAGGFHATTSFGSQWNAAICRALNPASSGAGLQIHRSKPVSNFRIASRTSFSGAIIFTGRITYMAKGSGTDTELLKAALYGYQVQSERLEATIADIQAQLGHRGPGRREATTNGIDEAAPKKRTMSASARRRIAVAQKKRWATYHEQQAASAKPAKRKKHKMSAEGKARIAAATKARWAAFRKAKEKAKA